MKELEDELRAALRREQPPAGFTERVLQHAALPRSQRHRQIPSGEAAGPGRKHTFVRWAAAAALVAAVGGGIQYRSAARARAERAAGEAAKEQVVEALRITAGKLQLVQAKVREVGS